MQRDHLTSDYLATQIRAWLRAEPRRSQAELARLSGVTTATISDILSGKRGAGRKSLRALGRVLGTTPDQIEEAAAEWARKGQIDTAQFPNLEAAAAYLRQRGRLDERTLTAVRRFNPPKDLDEQTWMIILNETLWNSGSKGFRCFLFSFRQESFHLLQLGTCCGIGSQRFIDRMRKPRHLVVFLHEVEQTMGRGSR